MTTTLHHRSRLDPPPMPHGRVELLPPPEVVTSEGSGAALLTALPMLGSVGSIVFVATAQPGVRGYVAAGLFLLASLGFVVVSVWRQRSQRQTKSGDQRREYMSYLGQVRQSARRAARQQRDALLWDHPDPAHLPALADERSRLWERKPGDDDFLHVRYGRAAQPLALTLVPPESAPLDRVDPVAASGLHRLLATHRIQPDLPASFHLGAFSQVQLVGDRGRARSLARAIVCGAATFHAPADLLVAVVASDENMRHWEWVKWLPHAGSPRERDGIGPARLMGGSIDELVPLLPADLPERPRFSSSEATPMALPHLLVVVDGGHVSPANGVLTEEGLSGVTVLDLPDFWGEQESENRLRLHVSADGGCHGESRPEGQVAARVELARQDPIEAVGDQADVETAEALARRLTPLYVAGRAERGDRRSSDLMDLLGLPHVSELDVNVGWRRRPPRDHLRVPIGLSDDGGVVHLDIKETAEQGMGPHGLVIGATGSGKSELLRTLVLALALTHSPEDLNLVLIDFKGGATFAGMAEMPHVSALITNLAQEMPLVDRMYAALDGETRRRQSLLRPAPNRSYQSLKEYRKARAQGEDLPGIPSLFIVIDEFSELLASRPEFADLFAQTGRLGRSLGMHLLFASQRLEESKLRGLESNLSYRVGLRTFSAAESRGVLGVPDAYELPAVPGMGILRPDPTTFVRFKAAYVSGPPPRKDNRGSSSRARQHEVVPFSVGPVAPHLTIGPDLPDLVPSPGEPADSDDSRSTLDIAVAKMRGQGPAAHRVWLPPLEIPPTLDVLLPDLAREPDLGLVSLGQRGKGALTVPIGTVDKPGEQKQEQLEVSLAGARGHVAVVGAPLSGKSTLLRTLVTSLALTHTPQEVHFYVLDFGGSFTALQGLPHLSGAAGRSEHEVVHRIVAELEGVLDAREAFFRRNGIDSMETYRARREPGVLDDGYGDLFLVVDSWTTLRADFDTLESEVSDLAQRGLTFGVHLMTSTTRWADFRSQVRDLFGTRLELRLGDPLDSDIDRRLAVSVPDERPGRGLTESRHHFLAALPRIDGLSDGLSVAEGLFSLVASVRDAWAGPSGPRLRLLPEKVSLAEVRSAAFPVDAEGSRRRPVDPAARRIVLGVDEQALAPVVLDVDAEPHLIVFGEGSSGKSTLLRTYVQEVMDSRSPDQAKFMLVDYRRSLLGEVPDEYVVSYSTSSVQAAPEVERLAGYLRTRLPSPDATAEELRSRAWREGKADLFLVVDDYELVAGSSGSPLSPLVDLIPQAVDVGLHVVLARRSGGASRALYEPVIQSLRDLAAPGVMLSGSPEEGPLLGHVRPQPAAPGRARLVTRARGVEVMQVAHTDPRS